MPAVVGLRCVEHGVVARSGMWVNADSTTGVLVNKRGRDLPEIYNAHGSLSDAAAGRYGDAIGGAAIHLDKGEQTFVLAGQFET